MLLHLASPLAPDGTFFASLKEGSTEEHQNERLPRDMNTELLEYLVGQVQTLGIQ